MRAVTDNQVAATVDRRKVGRGARFATKTLKNEAMGPVFTIFSDYNIDFYNGCIDAVIKMIDVSHEHSAGPCFRIAGSYHLSRNQFRYGQALKCYRGRGDIGSILADVCFDRFAESTGGSSFNVTKPQDIRPALDKARDSGHPALVNVMTDRGVYSRGTMNQTMYK